METKYIGLPHKGSEIVVEEQEICYIERANRITNLHLTDQIIEVAEKLSDIEKYLNIDIFVRCHNSFIVNFEKVRRFDRSEFIMRNGESVSISRSRYSEVKERFDKWAAMQRLGE